MSWFKPKLNISEGKKYDVSEMSLEGVTQEEAVKKNKKLIEIFKAFNFNGGEKLEDIELAAAMDAFEKIDSQFGNKDGKLSKSELEKGAAWLNKEFGLEGDKAIDRKDLKEFIKNIEKATRKDKKIDTDEVIENWTEEQKKLAQAKLIEQAKPEISEPQAKKPEKEDPPEIKQPPALNSYTVQEGENYTDIIIRSLKSQGIENPTEEQIKQAKENFNKNNPGALRKTKKGTEYLLVGAKVNLEGKLEDKNNASEQINKYNEKHKTPPKIDPPAEKDPKTPAEKDPKTPEEKDPKKPTDPQDPKGTQNPAKPDKEIPKTKPEAAKALGLRETFATKSNGIYYDEKTMTHYKWNDETKQFDEYMSDGGMVDISGVGYDSKGEMVYNDGTNEMKYQLKTDGTFVETKKDGSTTQYTIDGNRRTIKQVERDENGKITRIADKVSYDTDGKLISKRDIFYNTDGKVSEIQYRSVAENGQLEVVIRDAKGKKLRTEIYQASIYDKLKDKKPVSVSDDALISEYKNELVGTYFRLKECAEEHPLVHNQNPKQPYILLSTGDQVKVHKDDKGNITQIAVSLDGDKDDKYDVIYYNDNTVKVQKDGVGDFKDIRNGTDFKKIMQIIGPMFEK